MERYLDLEGSFLGKAGFFFRIYPPILRVRLRTDSMLGTGRCLPTDLAPGLSASNWHVDLERLRMVIVEAFQTWVSDNAMQWKRGRRRDQRLGDFEGNFCRMWNEASI